MVLQCQSVFIKERSIQDDYIYVQGAIRHYHKSLTLMLFLKLDIAKAFDKVRWDYILEVMQWMGFGQRWRVIICLIWGHSHSKILLNGMLGKSIKHHIGLRQGDLCP